MKILASMLFAVVLTACALTGASPEAQIKTGADGNKLAATLGTTLLRNNKITVPQAKGYSAILHTASDHLNTAFKALEDCRKKTGSTPKTTPDPCASSVEADIKLALTIGDQVYTTLKAKE